jgi:pilus assembly protein CpaB
MNRRLIGIVAAVALTLVGTLLLVVYVQGAEDRALAGERTVNVLVVAEAIDKGTPAAALTGKVKVEQVPAKAQADGAVLELSSLRGLVASTDLVPGEQVIRGRFVKPDVAAQAGIDTSKLLKLSAALDPERVVGGVVRPGDTVAVLITTTDDPKQTHAVLHQIPVVGVQGAPAVAGEEGDGSRGEPPTTSFSGSGDQILVTLAFETAQAERFVWGLEHGAVWLAHEPRAAVQTGTPIVDRGTVLR